MPVKLVDPLTRYKILRNINLQLSEVFELIFGNKTENMQQYYQIAKVAVVANLNHVKLLISIPLKDPFKRRLTTYSRCIC